MRAQPPDHRLAHLGRLVHDRAAALPGDPVGDPLRVVVPDLGDVPVRPALPRLDPGRDLAQPDALPATDPDPGEPVVLRRLGGHHVAHQVDAGGHLDRARPARPGSPRRAPGTAGSSAARPGRGRGRPDTTGRARTPRPRARPRGRTSPPDGFRYANRTARPACTASRQGCSASSAASSRGSTSRVRAGSTSTPPARSLSSAPRAASASSADCQSRAARPTAAASSGSSDTVGQLVVAAGDPVALLGVEDARPAGLQRDAELAQLGLVPLEHALERLVGPRAAVVRLVPGNRGADPLGGQELPGRQQAQHEVDQSLGPARRHPSSVVAAGPASRYAASGSGRIR